MHVGCSALWLCLSESYATAQSGVVTPAAICYLISLSTAVMVGHVWSNVLAQMLRVTIQCTLWGSAVISSKSVPGSHAQAHMLKWMITMMTLQYSQSMSVDSPDESQKKRNWLTNATGAQLQGRSADSGMWHMVWVPSVRQTQCSAPILWCCCQGCISNPGDQNSVWLQPLWVRCNDSHAACCDILWTRRWTQHAVLWMLPQASCSTWGEKMLTAMLWLRQLFSSRTAICHNSVIDIAALNAVTFVFQ